MTLALAALLALQQLALSLGLCRLTIDQALGTDVPRSSDSAELQPPSEQLGSFY